MSFAMYVAVPSLLTKTLSSSSFSLPFITQHPLFLPSVSYLAIPLLFNSSKALLYLFEYQLPLLCNLWIFFINLIYLDIYFIAAVLVKLLILCWRCDWKACKLESYYNICYLHSGVVNVIEDCCPMVCCPHYAVQSVTNYYIAQMPHMQGLIWVDTRVLYNDVHILTRVRIPIILGV